MEPTEFASRIIDFIKKNNIDYKNTAMLNIIVSYFKAQNDAIEIAAKQVQSELELELN